MEGLLRTGDAVQEQSAEWWATEEGKTKLKTYNTINLDRIHLKIAESNVVKRCDCSCPLCGFRLHVSNLSDSDGCHAVSRLLELVFDDTPHVSEYAEQVIKFMVSQGAEETK